MLEGAHKSLLDTWRHAALNCSSECLNKPETTDFWLIFWSVDSSRHRHKCLITLRDHRSFRTDSTTNSLLSNLIQDLFLDFYSEVSGTADKMQDIVIIIKASSGIKVSEEVCQQRLSLYKAQQILSNIASFSTQVLSAPIKETCVP